jgi:hypothetical protein
MGTSSSSHNPPPAYIRELPLTPLTSHIREDKLALCSHQLRVIHDSVHIDQALLDKAKVDDLKFTVEDDPEDELGTQEDALNDQSGGGSQRPFRLFLRPSPASSKGSLWVLCHGTDETMYDTELLIQEDGKFAFLDLLSNEAEEFKDLHGILFVQSGWFTEPNSTHHPYREDKVRAGWSEGVDRNYVLAAIDKVCEEYSQELDKDSIFLTGYSNGGFFVMDLWDHFPGRFKGVVNYCGGMSTRQCRKYHDIPYSFWRDNFSEKVMAEFELPDSIEAWENLNCWKYQTFNDDAKNDGKLIVITGLKDENRTPCLRTLICAHKQMKDKKHDDTTFKSITFQLRKRQKHEVLSSDAGLVWELCCGDGSVSGGGRRVTNAEIMSSIDSAGKAE